MSRSPVRWILVLSIGAAAGIGMARFAFGPVLPALRDDLGWSLTTGGAVQSANLGAYLVGSLLTPRIIRRYGLRWPYWYSYIAVGVTLLLTGAAGRVGSHVALRLIAGGTAGVLLISGGIIAARLSTGATSGLIIGLFFGGVGAGIAVTGLLLPVAFGSAEGWRIVWWVMGAATVIAAPFVFRSLREACASIDALPEPPLLSSARPGGVVVLIRLEIAYILFGLGSIGYMTFVVALLRGQDASPAAVGAFWAVLGMASLVAGRLWAAPINRSESGRLAGLMYLFMAGASLVVTGSSTLGALIFSAAAFGSVFVSVVSATTHLIRIQLPQDRWTATLARFTVGYGVAMTIGSTAAGAMSDRFGLSTSILISALVLLIAAVAAGLQPGVTAET
ncbi:MAG TPA: YbfB/YjiJ family MFS transporter [Gemmatimonadota bacterium]|nr:YbfB/YjiJ family MFS transporter [Gemmatimonadota bacterium]